MKTENEIAPLQFYLLKIYYKIKNTYKYANFLHNYCDADLTHDVFIFLFVSSDVHLFRVIALVLFEKKEQ